ncbi:hypothetical protein B0T26DRAFT_309894 [Lasiosphaeria miniovina]|uniref:Ankyrin n=1 Tax=Lasiosphaeria miniovina TaxID=1954250 RepID=A0AA40ALC3_9PEZI|nr:uncharacterized protein B0T26DRAFT_309894 [Lasiosphaeria miniovina]KAK0717986.1 hypothetical protein B0T26DRAFT_309894 [Lasiosphaeria miniovina]
MVANSEICSYLISEGADLAASQSDGWRPLDIFHLRAIQQVSLAATMEHNRSQFLMQDSMHFSRIFTNTAHDNSDAFDDNPGLFLVSPRFHESSSREIEVLEATVENGREYIRRWCSYLIQQDVRCPDRPFPRLEKLGTTHLHLEAAHAILNPWGLDMLVFCGADVNAVNTNGEIVLTLILQSESGQRSRRLLRNCLRSLLAHGAKPSMVDSYGLTPTLHASKSGVLEGWAAELQYAGYDVCEISKKDTSLMEQLIADRSIKARRGAISTSLEGNIDYRQLPTRRAPWTGVTEQEE